MDIDLNGLNLEAFIKTLSPSQKAAIHRQLLSAVRHGKVGVAPLPPLEIKPISNATRQQLSNMWKDALLELEKAQLGLGLSVERLQAALDRALSVKPMGEKLPPVKKHFLLYKCRECGKERR